MSRRAARGRMGVVTLMMFLLGLSVFGKPGRQQDQPTSYEGFEGRTVWSVEISANPAMDVQSFRELLAQKAGQPFAIGAIRESVAALQKTNLFSRVQVSVEPQQQGLRVLFILEPAYYVGMVFFPGATSAFTYARLLQAVNIPDQTAFTEDLLPRGKDALLRLFQTEGYFAAGVAPEFQRDDAHRTVNIVFHSDLGPRARIEQLLLPGVPEAEADTLRHELETWWAKFKGASLKPGHTYSQARIRKSVGYLRDYLQKSGHLTPVVRLDKSTYHSDTNTADLVFDVQPGPRISIRVAGAKVSTKTLKRLIPIYEENAVDPELVSEGERNLTYYFQSKSYFDVKVNSRLDQADDATTIVYQIERGTKHRVNEVQFEGNHYFSEKQLAPRMLIKKKKFLYRGHFSADLLRKSVKSLTALYQTNGFEKVSISPEVRDHEPDVDVTFRITEGEQDKVHLLKIVDGQSAPVKPPVDEKALNLGPGKPYSPSLLESDRNKIIAQYLNNGYLNARFDSRVSKATENPHLFDVVYVLDEGPLARVSKVGLLGTNHTQPGFIREVTEQNVKEGEPLSEGKFLTAESDLYSLGIFDWASVGPLRPVSDQTEEEVLVKVHESKRNTMDVGGGIEIIPRSGNIPVGAVALPGLPPINLGGKFTTSQKSFFGPRMSFQLARHDIRGRAQTAAFGIVFSRLDQRGTLSYSNPHLQGSTLGSLLSVSGERTTENPIYTAALGQASWQIEKALDRKRTRLFRLRYSYQRTDLTQITIPELVLPEDQHVRTSTFSLEYVRDTRDVPLDAHHGIFQTFTFGVTPTALGSSSDFVRFLGQTAFYKPIRPWLTWANNFRFGIAAPFAGSFVPLSERFFTGGPDSLRGFPIDGAGPQRPVTVCSNPANPSTCSQISVPVGGEMLAIFNSEARFPIPLKSGLGGVIFYDGGNVFSHVSLGQFTGNYSNSIGIGFRYKTPVGPIRFDIGRNLSPIPGVNATQYFVTLGQAF